MAQRWRVLCNSIIRQYSQTSAPGSSSTPPKPASSQVENINVNVPGLSEAVVEKCKGPVGPGVDPSKSGDYKVPEYFCYNTMSYFEAEIEMSKYRLPQPVAPRK